MSPLCPRQTPRLLDSSPSSLPEEPESNPNSHEQDFCWTLSLGISSSLLLLLSFPPRPVLFSPHLLLPSSPPFSSSFSSSLSPRPLFSSFCPPPCSSSSSCSRHQLSLCVSSLPASDCLCPGGDGGDRGGGDGGGGGGGGLVFGSGGGTPPCVVSSANRRF